MNGVVKWLEDLNGRPHWMVQAKPNVMIRIKRCFEKISKTQHGYVTLVDTPENSRELLWFLERFPMECSAMARMRSQAETHLAYEKRVADVLEESRLLPASLEMALPARPYQQTAATLAATTGRLLLADDLGLGKTISAIATLSVSGKLPALVVTLTHLPRQWEKEIHRFLPSLRVHILKSTKPYPLDADVVISNYHKLGGWSEVLAARSKSVIFDEIQELRHAESSTGPTVKYAAASYIAKACDLKLGLSATPIYNYGGEMFNVLSILDPDCLGSRDEFGREWAFGSDEKAKIKDPKAFGQYLRDAGIMLRRTRAEVGRELAALTTIPYEVETDRKALDAIAGEATALAQLILSDSVMERGEKFRAGGQLDYKLRRATGLAKAPFVADFVRMLVESGEKVVLYGWHHDVYALWKASLKDLDPGFFTGQESTTQKEQQVKRFVDGDTDLLILSLRSGAGLDGLQAVCRTVVFGELDWSPGVHEQAIGRVHRDGQSDPVCAYFLISDHGSDPIVSDVLGVKRGQIEGLRDPDAPLVESGADPDHMRRLAEEFLKQKGRPATAKPALVIPRPAPTKKQKPKVVFVGEEMDLFSEVAS